MEELLRLFKEKGLTLGSVESMSGGLFASSITSVPGASQVFKGSIVTYQTCEKIKLLGIDESIIKEHGVVSKAVALEMACKGQELLDVDVCISITGNAGPTCEPGGMPVGRAYIGLATKSECIFYELNLEGSRNEIREKSVKKMTDLLKKALF